MLQAGLKVLGGKFQGKLIPLNTKKFLVGREQDCQLRPNNDLVSRHHCVFLVDDYTVRLRDLGSTNGTRVNGELVRQEIVLKDGDTIAIGKLELELSLRQIAAVSASSGRGAAAGGIDLPGSGFDIPVGGAPSETSYELPAVPETVEVPTVANFADDTAIMNSQQAAVAQAALQQAPFPQMMPGYGYPSGMPMPGMPMPGYPPMPQQMPGYPMGYPGYPPMAYPPGYAPPGMTGYPGYPMAQVPEAVPAMSTAEAAAAIPVKLPPPEATGVREAPAPAPVPVAAPPPAADGSTPPPAAKGNEKSSTSAADIIKQYMQRRVTK